MRTAHTLPQFQFLDFIDEKFNSTAEQIYRTDESLNVTHFV